VKKISEAIENARSYMDASVVGDEAGMPGPAIAWALIAIAEALLEQRKQAEFRAEVEDMRQERRSND